MTRDEALGARDAVVGVFVDGAEVTITEVHDDDTVTVVDNGESVVGRFPLADVEVSGRR